MNTHFRVQLLAFLNSLSRMRTVILVWIILAGLFVMLANVFAR